MSRFSSGIAGGAICTTILAYATSSHASAGYICTQMPSFSCDVDQDCAPLYDEPTGCDAQGNNCYQNPVVCNVPTTNCTYQNGSASCSWQQYVSTPAVVWRSFNGMTHAYTAQAIPPQGYYLEGTVFSLATDNYAGAVEFPLTGGGPLTYFPVGDSAALSADPDLTPLYHFVNPMYGDDLYTGDPTEAQNFPCVPGYCAYTTPSGVCLVQAPPNCYIQIGIFGYVGP
jgi:hypothetical protein